MNDARLENKTVKSFHLQAAMVTLQLTVPLSVV